MILTARARGVAAAVAAGAAVGHLLDELGALPGVTEAATVRHVVLDPARAPGLLLIPLAALAGGWTVDRLLRRRRPLLGVVALLAMQLVAAVGVESVARARLEADVFETRGLAAAVVQLGLAVLVAVLASGSARMWRALALPTPVEAAPAAPLSLFAWPVVRSQVVAASRGRAPPACCAA